MADAQREPIIITCKRCKWSGDVAECIASYSVYHDMLCPKCQSSEVDTSQLRERWEAEGNKAYNYGNDNTLHLEEKEAR